ncbi:hypothetical protein HYH03_006044 [Edaphochlamys debaryana]|uniref:non-specific serine/threonine protein kinase n=1 Tax=Edaphochlamys debaryana TaxID=47281 RepID=A0A835Y649_9CHLO|nr:hypothetical protein HYH03_006044 [Edaphochlamys debaryana]|eukprot:KAG2495802.1 hypothetical protein HYH03_006044 [Edaphochlamys debaryana]
MNTVSLNYGQLIADCWGAGVAWLPFSACGLPNLSAWLPSGVEYINVGHRRFRVLQKLGEGGYAVVLLAVEVATPEHHHVDPEPRALKKVLIQSREHLEAVQLEMRIHSAVQHHPNILPLLDFCCTESTYAPGPAASRSSPGGHPGSVLLGVTPMLPPSAHLSSTPPPHLHPSTLALTPPHLAPIVEHGGARGGGAGAGSLPGHGQAGAGHLPGPGPAAGAMQRSAGGAGAGSSSSGGGAGAAPGEEVACFLFPVFRDGTLAAELDRLAARNEMLPTREVLSIFVQMARAVRHVHQHNYAHRDVKPLNMLIAVQDGAAGGGAGSSGPGSAVAAQRQAGPGRPAAAAGGVEAGVSLMASSSAPSGPRYRCVLMDFGSARPRLAHLHNRAQARAMVEDAEAHCSAPYRAPELFDPPSPATMDYGLCDVWALGASLFHVMYGSPPFARAMNESGGSLALAVLNCAIGWPRPGSPAYPPELHQLVTQAMQAEPCDRPTADQLVGMAEALLERHLPDPATSGQPPGAVQQRR